MTEKQPPVEMNFETFVLSLGTATLVALGEVKNPISGKEEKNLESAKQHIDILDMLLKKTQGNLTDPESKLLQQVLYEIRMKYISKTGGDKKDPK
jgi:hypothetical protein